MEDEDVQIETYDDEIKEKIQCVTDGKSKVLNLVGVNLNSTEMSKIVFDDERLKVLKVILLSHNQLTIVPEKTFASMHLTNLKTLHMSYNQLTSLPEKTFACLNNLEELSLDCNQLSSLPENIFVPLPKLYKLDLSKNKFASLPENIFAPLSKLTILHLYENKFASLPENIFASLIDLRQLHISSNQLTSLPENIFASLTNLQKLDISSNQLISLPENIFDSLINLNSLYIGSNNLTSLPEKIVASLTNLQVLWLNKNKLISLPEKIFASLTNLQTLWLSENRLTSLPEKIFTHLVNLKRICVAINQLTNLPSSILDCGQLTDLYFGGNEITPDIRFQRFLLRIQNYKNHGIFTDSQNIHASSVQTSTKLSINALFKDSFDCSKDGVIKECLTWNISCLPGLLTYLDDTDVHSTLLVSFYDVFIKVFGRIISHPNKTDIISRLDEELKESECKCFTGRLTRLVNCLVGFYDDIFIGISDSERISAIILTTLAGREMTDELKKICTDKLKAIGVSNDEIDKWL